MRFISLLICVLLISGCDNRSSLLPTTDKWVRFHCLDRFSQKPIFMVEMPGKPRAKAETSNLFGSDITVEMHDFRCGNDGLYSGAALKLFDDDAAIEGEREALQGFGKHMMKRTGYKVLSEKTFLIDEKYPAVEFSGEIQKQDQAQMIFRGRFILCRGYVIQLLAIGNSSAIREPEVSYFFDSLLLYK